MADLPRDMTVACHDGIFHADEVFAIAALRILCPDLTVVRTRDPALLAECYLRVDVGDDYNHNLRTYDHHMAWFNARHKKPFRKRLPNGEWQEWTEGPLRSGFGLIWMHYGLDVVKDICKEFYSGNPILDALREIDFVDIQQDVDNNLVSRIDAIDNGETDKFNLNTEPFRAEDISRLIGNYNPTVIELRRIDKSQANAYTMDRFHDATKLAREILISNVTSRAELTYFRAEFMQQLGKRDPSSPVLVLEEYIPWAYAYGRAGDATNGTEMLVFPSQNGTWICQTPKFYEKRDTPYFSPTLADGSRRRYKHQAPSNICGLRDTELEKITGIKDVTFVHKGGWMGVAKTKEAAISLAEYFITYGE